MTNPIVSEWLVFLDANLRENWEERAAIMEYDGGLNREVAEAFAMLLVIRQYPRMVLTKIIGASP